MSKQTKLTPDAIKKHIEQRIETDEAVKAWFQQFSKLTWPGFISGYSRYKSTALQYPDAYNDLKPKHKIFNQQARIALEHIQQKKLFNLQCQWRAGSLDLPFVKVTYDFQIFGEHIMECPFLPPVEQDEVELFIQFLKSPHSSEYLDFEYHDWQDYDTFKEEIETSDFCVTPDWYEFYDGMRGTGFLLRLPDVRGTKQEFYREIAIKHEYPDRDKRKPDPEYDKPMLDESEHHIEFARLFEDPDKAETIINFIKGSDNQDKHEHLDEHFEYLKTIPETFPFVQHHDWREALRQTALQYKRDRLAEALPRVWRQYIRDVDDDREAYINRRIARTDKEILDKLDSEIRPLYIDRVLKGRKLLGEPEDFDY